MLSEAEFEQLLEAYHQRLGRDLPRRRDSHDTLPGGDILSMIHDLVLGLLKTAGSTNAAQGRRWFDRHMQEAFALLIAQKAPS